jgi:signal peptidase II
MKRIFFISAFLVIVIDQITKYLIRTSMKMFDAVLIIKDIFQITYIENTGISFGLLGGSENPVKRWTLVAIVSVAAIMITCYWLFNRKNNILFDLSCGFIVGGAIGNLIDRIIKGSVTDFIEIGYKEITWPVFNMADTFVSIGVFLFFIYYVLYEVKQNASDSD